MKIFIMAYARKNLGDDIFIKMLLEKYSQIDFYIKINDEKFVEQLAKNNNLSYAVNIYPRYGSDVGAALRGGNNIKGGLIGPRVSYKSNIYI